LQGMNPLSETPLDQQLHSNLEKSGTVQLDNSVSTSNAPAPNETPVDNNQKGGTFLVLVDEHGEEEFDNLDEVRSFVEYLTMEQDISLKNIHVFKKLELDFGIFIRE